MEIGDKRKLFLAGMKDGIPIGLGYFAVALSLGIAAYGAGLNWFESALASLLCNASAGEYAGFTLIAASATYVEIAIMTLIANARYLLMSFALSQKMSPDLPLLPRLIIGFDVTDELFGIAIARPGYVEPQYMYGAMTVSMPLWALGTAIGAFIGNVLPIRVISALAVTLYGMFLAIIIPEGKKNKVVAVVIALCFALSYAFTRLAIFSFIPSGTKIIILTVTVSAVAALAFPHKDKDEDVTEGETTK